ncbi:hypothetical protein LA080_002914 [Diaporthe eres]|nr:hypothetical protein LA080_002914 [Diaporthe eres]
MTNALTASGRAQISMAVTVNLTLFVACMGALLWDGLGKNEKKNKDIINIFFAIGCVSSAAGFMLGFLADTRDYLNASNYKVLRGQIIAFPFITITSMLGAMLVFVFHPIGDRGGLESRHRPHMPLCGCHHIDGKHKPHSDRSAPQLPHVSIDRDNSPRRNDPRVATEDHWPFPEPQNEFEDIELGELGSGAPQG